MFEVQSGKPCLWLQVDPDQKETTTYLLTTVGTGHDYDAAAVGDHLGSYQVNLNGGVFVGHVFGKIITG